MAITETDIFRKALLALNIRYDKIMHDKNVWDAKKKAYDEASKVPSDKRTEEQNTAISDFEKVKDDDPGLPIEVEYCMQSIKTAEDYCATLRPWFWLVKQEQYKHSDRLVQGYDEHNCPIFNTYRGCDFGYSSPSDMFYPYIVNDDYNADYERIEDDIYFKKDVHELYYVTNEIKRRKNDEVVYTINAPVIYFSLIAARLAIEVAPFIAPDTNIEQRASQQFQLSLQALLKIEEHSRRERNALPEEFVL